MQVYRSKIILAVFSLLFIATSWAVSQYLWDSIITTITRERQFWSPANDFDMLAGSLESPGADARPTNNDMTQVLDLPAEYVPDTGESRRPGRLVVVGDVHGQKTSLLELLDKISFRPEQDHLVLAGDLISKGPDSAGVVDLAIELGASAVRGNHEDRVIVADTEMKAAMSDLELRDTGEHDGPNLGGSELQTGSHGDNKDRALVKGLGDRRLTWLKQLPIILRVGKMGDMGEVVVVHAGLVPGVKLEQQDPVWVMNMRGMDKHGIPTDDREGLEWSKVWNKFQVSLPENERTTVIYGHDQKRGLQLHEYSFGIDTGCIKGGKLTALVIEGGKLQHHHRIVQVKCKDGR